MQFNLQVSINVWQDVTWGLGKEQVPGYGYEVIIEGNLPQSIQMKGSINQDGSINRTTAVDHNLRRSVLKPIESAITAALHQQRQLHQGQGDC